MLCRSANRSRYWVCVAGFECIGSAGADCSILVCEMYAYDAKCCIL